MRTSPGATIAAAALVLVGLAGCSASVSVGTPQVTAEDVAQQVSDSLGESVGVPPEKVECPDDLDAEIDAELRCVLTDAGVEYGVTVTVTAVDGKDVDFTVLVDDGPLSGGEQ
jgi:ABC-type Fe3+-hydroxamate transport system substrate-binding protein